MAVLTAAMVGIGVIAAAPTPAVEPPEVPAQIERVAAVFDGINAYRAAKDLEPLLFSPEISEGSLEWSLEMAETGVFAHSPDPGSHLPRGSSREGEIIASRWDRDALGLVDQWIASPSHEAALTRDYTVMGVGIAIGDEGKMYGTVHFGLYRDPDAIDAFVDVRAWLDAIGAEAAASVEPAAPPVPTGPTVSRVAGADRFESAVLLSRRYNDPATVQTAYLVSGEAFADALSAAPAAAQPGGALLLTQREQLPAAVGEELARLAPARVVVVGGYGAISAGVETAVRELVPLAQVDRIAGADRYATSAAIARDAFPGSAEAFVASRFADALSAAPIAAQRGAPVLLTPPGELAPALRDFLGERSLVSITIAGGTPSVSIATERSIIEATALRPSRLAGSDRFATNVLAARRGSVAQRETVLLAPGYDFPDALAAAALANRVGPLLLTAPSCVPAGTLAMLESTYRPSEVVLLGTEADLGAGVAALEHCG
ncbi:cell wall-binding repeat-containing protein [Agrococcus sp. TF02-05]|uniref:cell wall-binding repeat-containing protein n=1 Tax=Agrococcus sp. TF02-05 TaxID=2815211 RepID=UPI001AA1B38E|nr:cell wall-binding repeat-containing protein [Agrococcus sp. TF02-05]MBO1770930.1 cell wall-binding repeat-containing protein [Agrococcus sp. TF02-05]